VGIDTSTRQASPLGGSFRRVGWNTRLIDGRWVPTFPNASYLFARQEWERWEHAELRARYTTDPYYEDSLLPVMESGRAQLVDSDYAFVITEPCGDRAMTHSDLARVRATARSIRCHRRPVPRRR
jgi:hypothetical protein